MSNEKPSITRGDEYVIIYSGGPNDGQTGTRISTDGTVDDEVTVLTAVNGKETMIDYNVGTWREIGGQYHVTYTYDQADSEQVDDPVDRDGGQ